MRNIYLVLCLNALTGLLAGCADVHVTNSQGWTALMFAARYGQQAAVRTLLDNG